MDDKETQKEAQETSSQDNPPIPPPLPIPKENAYSSETTQESEEPEYIHQGFVDRKWEEFKNAGADRHFELALTLAIALFAGCQLIITIINANSSSIQIDKLIGAANRMNDAAARIEDAADSFSTSSASIDRGVGNAVEKLGAQATELETARKTSEANSKQALDATIDNFHKDQRAWLSLDVATGVPTNSIFEIRIPISNTGRTPAKDAVFYFNSRIVNIGGRLDAFVFEGAPQPFGYISPGKDSKSFRYNGDNTKGIANTIPNFGAQAFEVYGAATYRDVSGDKHWLTYCFYNRDGKEYLYCPMHNDIGDGPLPSTVYENSFPQ